MGAEKEELKNKEEGKKRCKMFGMVDKRMDVWMYRCIDACMYRCARESKIK